MNDTSIHTWFSSINLHPIIRLISFNSGLGHNCAIWRHRPQSSEISSLDIIVVIQNKFDVQVLKFAKLWLKIECQKKCRWEWWWFDNKTIFTDSHVTLLLLWHLKWLERSLQIIIQYCLKTLLLGYFHSWHF